MNEESLDKDSLIEQLFEQSFKAREERVEKNVSAFAEAKAKVEQTLDKLRRLYRADPDSFEDEDFEEIRAAKIAAGLITRDDLDREERQRSAERNEKSQARRVQRITRAHRSLISILGKEYQGVRVGRGNHRVARCYRCKESLDNAVDLECISCGWIICDCGACGCGYQEP